MTTVVISQPMFFPWPGMFEQIRLADVYVHYDDVLFSKGSFVNRVQVKTAQGSRWLTAPLARTGGEIRDLVVDERHGWRDKHLRTLREAYARARYRDEMLAVAEPLYADPESRLAELNIACLERLSRYLELAPQFLRSSALGISGTGSERVLQIVRSLGGTVYVTGHGARNYLDHELFEASGVAVEYLDYEKRPYEQLHGGFDPHVTILDLIANLGRAGASLLASPSVPWRKFLSARD